MLTMKTPEFRLISRRKAMYDAAMVKGGPPYSHQLYLLIEADSGWVAIFIASEVPSPYQITFEMRFRNE